MAPSSFDPSPSTPPEPRTLNVPLEHIRTPDNLNGRLELQPDRLAHLVKSIIAHDLIHPITIQTTPTGYQLVAGRYRLEAFRRMNRPTIPARVITTNDHTAAGIRLAENVTRTQLTPVEEAAQLSNLVEHHPAGVDGAATITGRSTTWIQDRLDILTWPPNLQHAVHHRLISLSAAKRLARIDNPETRDTYIQHGALHGVSTRTAALWLQDANQVAPHEFTNPESPGFLAPPTIETKTLITCYMCQAKTDLNDTRSLRVCPNCLNALTTAANTMQEQPQHPPPPPTPQSQQP